jgi:hypothetical protein
MKSRNGSQRKKPSSSGRRETLKGGIPGFSADVALCTGKADHPERISQIRVEHGVVPAGARGCGFAIGLLILGIGTANPALTAAGAGAVAGWCG